MLLHDTGNRHSTEKQLSPLSKSAIHGGNQRLNPRSADTLPFLFLPSLLLPHIGSDLAIHFGDMGDQPIDNNLISVDYYIHAAARRVIIPAQLGEAFNKAFMCLLLGIIAGVTDFLHVPLFVRKMLLV